MARILIHFARYGPYHYARLRAANEILSPLGWEVIGLETAGNDATYAWDESESDACGPKVFTVFPGRVHEEITAAECTRTLHPLLDSLSPDAIAIAGWASPDALSCQSWCRKHNRRRIVMSETREADGKRVWWKELIKRYLISRFDGALVGGKSHRDYLVKLGMPADKIRFGYNVVDNAYFAAEAAKWRMQDANSSSQLSAFQFSAFTPKYFLASNRFIERKNLSRLIEAYFSYVQQSKINNRQSSIWPLCLLGDGELKPSLIAQCERLGLQVIEKAPWEVEEKAESGKQKVEIDDGDPNSSFQVSAFKVSAFLPPTVFFPGFRQIEELPRFYAHAGCFVHPAVEEPWGLVLNEAMACGLPILSGSNVGAAEELVKLGSNGFIFNACNVVDMTECLRFVAEAGEPELARMGNESHLILEKQCPTKAFGYGLIGTITAVKNYATQ